MSSFILDQYSAMRTARTCDSEAAATMVLQ